MRTLACAIAVASLRSAPAFQPTFNARVPRSTRLGIARPPSAPAAPAAPGPPSLLTIKRGTLSFPVPDGYVATKAPSRRRDTASLYARAVRLDKKGDLKGSSDLLVELSAVTPHDGRVWRRLSRLAASRGDETGARLALERGAAHAPDNAVLAQGLAQWHRRAGEADAARVLYRRSVELDPKLVAAYDSWSRLEIECGNLRSARALNRRALELGRHGPSAARLWHACATIESAAHDPVRARRAVTRGLAGAPTHPHLLQLCAKLEYGRGEAAEARRTLRLLTTTSPMWVEGWLALARLQEEEGDAKGARDTYAEVLDTEVGRGAVQLWQSWARLEEVAGDRRAASAVYARASLHHEGDAELWVQWAKLEVDRGNGLKARELMERALAAAAPQPAAEARVYSAYAELEMELMQYDRARRLFFKGVLASDGDAACAHSLALLHSWAVCEWQLGEPDRARTLFERAARLATTPEAAYAWQWFAHFERAQGNAALALHYVQRSINLDNAVADAWELYAALLEGPGGGSGGAALVPELRDRATWLRSSIAKEGLSERQRTASPFQREWKRAAVPLTKRFFPEYHGAGR